VQHWETFLLEYMNVHTMRKTFPPQNILCLKYPLCTDIYVLPVIRIAFCNFSQSLYNMVTSSTLIQPHEPDPFPWSGVYQLKIISAPWKRSDLLPISFLLLEAYTNIMLIGVRSRWKHDDIVWTYHYLHHCQFA